MNHHLWLTGALILIGLPRGLDAQAITSLSHPPLRPLPALSKRPLDRGLGYFVDPTRGKDDAAGQEKTPWRTIKHALENLRPGDTLYLRGGVYREPIYCAVAGKKDAPITIRACPGERVILD